jgi:sterol desaturase/sphingolipid hydroxylase (fatty acid hydroxylase superfamily)
MESIIHYFTHISSAHRSAILIGGILFFLLLEAAIPVKAMIYEKWRHAGINLFFTLTTVVVNFAFATVIVKSSDWTVANQWGFLNITPMPIWLFALLGLLLFDLIGAYLVHWVQHKVKWMWRFHTIHHTDTMVDTTTANRHHPIESLFRAVFTLLAVWVTGAPIWLVMLYQSLSALASQFNHANITINEKLDKWLSYVLVSPNMHKVHHHFQQPLTDTNYGNIFSVWDRLFGTFAVEKPAALTYGLDTHMEEQEHSDIKNLMQIPFKPYRAPNGKKF